MDLQLCTGLWKTHYHPRLDIITKLQVNCVLRLYFRAIQHFDMLINKLFTSSIYIDHIDWQENSFNVMFINLPDVFQNYFDFGIEWIKIERGSCDQLTYKSCPLDQLNVTSIKNRMCWVHCMLKQETLRRFSQ